MLCNVRCNIRFALVTLHLPTSINNMTVMKRLANEDQVSKINELLQNSFASSSSLSFSFFTLPTPPNVLKKKEICNYLQT